MSERRNAFKRVFGENGRRSDAQEKVWSEFEREIFTTHLQERKQGGVTSARDFCLRIKQLIEEPKNERRASK